MKQTTSLQIFIQPEVICDFLWSRWKHFEKSQSSAKHTAVRACIWFTCHHSKLDEVKVQVLLRLHDVFHSLCAQTHDHARHTTSKESVRCFHCFLPWWWRDILPPTPKALSRCTIVLHLPVAQPFTRSRAAYGGTYRGGKQLRINARNVHFMSYLISERAQPPAYSCLMMKTIHSAS